MEADSDDECSWKQYASEIPDLAAHVLVGFCNPRSMLLPWKCRLGRGQTSAAAVEEVPPSVTAVSGSPDKKEDDEMPSTSSAPPPALRSLDWGRRSRRSRMVKMTRIHAAPVARTASAAKVAIGKRRASPLSPLDGCSSGSTSWASGDGDEGTSSQEIAVKRRRSLGSAAIVVSGHGGGFPMTVVVGPLPFHDQDWYFCSSHWNSFLLSWSPAWLIQVPCRWITMGVASYLIGISGAVKTVP